MAYVQYKELFHRDSKGRVRIWWMEREGDRYCTHSGLVGGDKVISGWVTAKPKNVGRANETTPYDQADAEVKSKYDGKLRKKYFDSISKIDDVTFFKPMLAQDYKKLKKPVVFPILAQPKLDGIRGTFTPDACMSRSGTAIVTAPHIAKALERAFLQCPNVTTDGEFYNHTLKSDFEQIMSLVRQSKPDAEDLARSAELVEYHIYDIHVADQPGMSFWDRLVERKRFLKLVDSKMVVSVETTRCETQEDLDEHYGRVIEEGYEGQIVRVMDSPYKNARSKDLLKRKEFLDDEFEIIDVMEGKGNWSGVAKHLRIKLPNGETCKSGMRGNIARAKYILENKELFIGKMATIRFQEWSNYGVPRFPVAVALHEEERI